MRGLGRSIVAVAVLCVARSACISAQSAQPPAAASAVPAVQEPSMPGMPGMDMTGMDMSEPSTWHFMSDATVFGTFNRQGSPRGETEFRAQNWWMGMWGRQLGGGGLQFNTMLSLDPATVGRRGYSEIFQAGETLDGRPIVDRQHPHDFLMQLATVWHQPLGHSWTWTVAGAPVGEPALGPVAFMHRASASENPVAPLGHHTMDSTHIAMGVITTGLERGAFAAEASVFNGREPDERRWDLMDPGPLDSWSGRIWWRPGPGWEIQASHGLLKSPEPLEPGDLRRTTTSVAWMRKTGDDFIAVSAVAGRNDTDHGDANGALAELTRRKGRSTGFGRVEFQQVEAGLLLGDDGFIAARPTVTAVTVGGVRDVARTGKLQLGLGADLTLYAVPGILRSAYGARPASFHVFLRVRPVASAMGRMLDMTMTRPMSSPSAPATHHH